MFASLKTSIATSLTALTIGLALSASPADASGFRMGGGHRGGFGGFHGFRGYHGFGRSPVGGFHRIGWGWHRRGWGPGIGVGLVAVGASCIVYQPQYDDAGNYLGQYPVNVCQ
jgi:hypothetical protein